MKFKSKLEAIQRYAHYFGRFLIDKVAVFGAGSKRSGVVVIIRPDGIGDFIVWLDSARIIREHFRGRKIILLANPVFSQLATKIEYFDEVITIDPAAFEAKLKYRCRNTRLIRKLGAEIAIQPILSRTFWVGDSMVRASAAQQRIGSEGDLVKLRPWQRRIANGWYTQLIPASTKHLTELERNAEFLRGLGISDVEPAVARLSAVADLPPTARVVGEYFVIFPGAGSPKRLWSAASFGAVANTIAKQTSWRMVVCGSNDDTELALRIIDHAGLDGSISLTGKTTVPELVELVRGARLLIANETSAVHIAAAVGTPSVCLLGGGHFGRFVPYPDQVGGTSPVAVYHHMECYGCNWQCTQPHEQGQPAPCISAIKVEDVIKAAEPYLIKEEIKDVTHNH